MKEGMIQVYYGAGKGKTTASLGMALRALNYNFKINIFKFCKLRGQSGEDKVLSKYKNIKFFYGPDCRSPLINTNAAYKKSAYKQQFILFTKAVEAVKKNIDMLILDEVLDLVKFKVITEKALISLMKEKNKKTELILTGHFISKNLIKHADLVTEVKKIKHYYDKGVKARKGIEI